MNSFALVDHLGWVLIHSLWQFAAIALAAGLIVWTLRRSSATARYAVEVVAMGLVVAAPVITWGVLPVEESAIVVDVPSADAVAVIATSTEPVAVELPLPSDIALAADLPPESVEIRESSSSASPPRTETTSSPTWSEAISAWLHPWMAWIVSAWCVGVGLCSLRPLLGWHTLWRLRTIGVAPVSDDIRVALRRVAERLGLRQTVQVLQSTLAQVPVVVGYLRPVILLPVSLLTNMPPAQLEAILAHELAHIRRHDFVVNLLQTLVETLFFYHPAVWWLSRQIRVEREHCCDDLVVAALDNRADYGRALLAIEELRGERTLLALGAHNGSLLSRIRRIVGFRADRTATSPWLGILVVTSLFGVMLSVGVSGWTASAVKEPDPAGVTAEDEISVEKPLEPPKPVVAEWPAGRSIEFVGITKNTAPAKDGWLPSGLPIGDVGYWKSTTVLHSGNTTATYLENGPHPEPDAEAIDLLFRFRGLKAQPSLTFDLPANGAGYTHWPVADPYELRVSARRRGASPPGSTWSNPDGVVRVGLTDEPWGRWVKITPDGEVPEPIQPNELYATTYHLIDVQGAAPHKRSPLGHVILIREPSANTDPGDPWHRFAFEFRAIDTEGKDHWALNLQSQGDGQSKFVNSQYGVANSFPKGKTLSHYEYRVRPYRHWVTFENVSLDPGPQTPVSVTARSVVFTPAEKLADQFAETIRSQKLPFLDDAKIAHLRHELEDVLFQRPPKAFGEEEIQKLRQEFRTRDESLLTDNDVLQSIRFYYAGLKLPETTPAKWKRLADGVTQFVQREFDPREKDGVYLAFRDRFETLKLFVAVFLASPELTPAQARQLQDQRAWMKQQIFKLPESAKFQLKHGNEIDKLNKLFDDPLNPFFSRPWTESEFAKVQELYAESISRDQSATRLNWAVPQMVSAIVDVRSDRLRDAVSTRTVGWMRIGSRWTVNVIPQVGNRSLHLEDRHQRPESSYVDVPTMTFVDGKVPPKLEDHAEWLHRQAKGDLAYDAKADAFIAVRGARLAVLNATSWAAADSVTMPELKRLLLQSVESVPMSTFVKPSTFGDNRIRDLREDAPSLVVQTNEGRIAVIRLFTFGPVIQSHLRPLPPNPPLHPGDLPPPQVRVLDAAGNPATFNAIITAQVGYTKKPKPHWLEWRDKTGLVSLEMLPHGKHWIVAAAEFEQRTIFPLTFPTDERELEWRLRNSEPWTKHDLEFKTRFEPNEKTGGEIVVTIKNKFDKPLTLSEADLSLHVGETATFRVMSPQWVDRQFSSVEIAAGQTGEMRLSWNDWVRKGFWASRNGESISEPALPPDEPGRIYVRVCLGNSGALPMAVADPAVILGKQQAAPPDERTSLLESLIKTPKLETFQKLLVLADGKQPEVTALLDDSRRHSGKEKMGGEVKVVNNGQEILGIVSAKVIPLIEPSDVAVRVDPERRAECAFVFDMQGRLIDTLGGKLALGNSLGGDDIHVVNLGPEEDWFVRVMNFEKRGELNYRSDYYRIANPVVKSFRFYNLPNACSWSNGPEKIPRQGRLHPAHPQAQRPSYAGVPNAIPVTTAAGVPTVSTMVWDGDRNRWVAAPSAFVKGLPLYEVDTTWSREFEPLEPQAGQLTIEGGAREYDHWHAWEAAVPDQGHAVAVLTIPQRDGPSKVIEKKLAPGRHTVQLQAKPADNGQGALLKLWIDDDQKYDFDLPFAFGEAFANHPPIVHVLKPSESARLVHRLLKDTTAGLLFEIKLQPTASAVTSITKVDQQRGILKGRFIYDGEAPKPRDLRPDLSKLAKDSEVPRDSEGRPIGTAMWYLDYLKAGIRPKTEDASLLVDQDGGIANIVVWVTSKEIPWTPKDNYELPAMISVKDGHFTPRIRLLTPGRPLLVENTDPVSFTLATSFQRNSDVNVLLRSAADKKPFRIDELQSEQFPASYRSNVATWANGYIFVRDNDYVAVSQPDGTFTMPDLPPGEWEFRAWHERRGYLAQWPKGTFLHTVHPGDNNLGTIKLKPEFFEPQDKR